MGTSSETLPESLLHEFQSILNPIDLAALFSKGQPLEVELGCGDGSFLAEYARKHPERNFIGVERLMGRIRKLERKGLRAGLTNLRGVRIESSYFLEFLLPRHSVTALHIYFPDPWPKRKHRHHRLANEGFPGLAGKALGQRGTVFLRTDDADYFQQMLEVFNGSAEFEAVKTSQELSEVLTDFERDFLLRGIQTNRGAFMKK